MIGGWRALGEGRHDLHVGLGGGVGAVDDAERRLAAADQQERRAHVLGLRHVVLHVGPGAQLLERRLAVLAGRHGIDVGHRELAAGQRLGEVGALDLEAGELGILGRDQDDLVAQEIEAAVGLDQVLARDVVHPVEVGGDEHVGRRALLDLLGQRRARRVGDLGHRLAGVLGPGRGDLIEGVLQAGRGKDDHFVLRLGDARQERQGERQAEPVPSLQHTSLRFRGPV